MSVNMYVCATRWDSGLLSSSPNMWQCLGFGGSLYLLPPNPAHITLYSPVYCANTLVNFTYRNRTHILWEIAIAVISPNITNNTISTILQLTLPFK